jgi:hypothetical protein
MLQHLFSLECHGILYSLNECLERTTTKLFSEANCVTSDVVLHQGGKCRTVVGTTAFTTAVTEFGSQILQNYLFSSFSEHTGAKTYTKSFIGERVVEDEDWRSR